MKITQDTLRRYIKQEIQQVRQVREAEFYGETPGGQLTGTEEEDARFTSQLEAEKHMEAAGLDRNEISQMQAMLKSGDSAYFMDTPMYEKLYTYLEEKIPYEIVSQSMSANATPDEWILDYLKGTVSESGEFLKRNKGKMKITKEDLKQLIQQEYNAVLNEGDPQSRAITSLEKIGDMVKGATKYIDDRSGAGKSALELLEKAEQMIQTLWEEMQGMGDEAAPSKERELSLIHI